MLIEKPVSPAELANQDISYYTDPIIKTLNRMIKSTLCYTNQGPMACFDIANLLIYNHNTPEGVQQVFWPVKDGLLNRVLKEVISMYEGAGWIVYDDLKDAPCSDDWKRYLTFSANLWEKK